MEIPANGRSSGSEHANVVRLEDEEATDRRWPLPWRPPTACLVLTLVCCSPVLLPLACLSFPLLCLAELCFRLGRRSGRWKTMECQREPAPERRLLQRYLEDQLGLVGGGLAVDFGSGSGGA